MSRVISNAGGTYHPTHAIATPRASPSTSIAIAAIEESRNASSETATNLIHPKEAKWWSIHYGLDGQQPTSSSHRSSRRTTNIIDISTSSSGNGGTNISAMHYSPAMPHTIAVASGPRVLLYTPYGGMTSSAFGMHTLSRALQQQQQQQHAGRSKPAVVVQPEKTLPSPAPIYAVSYRADGRLIAYGGELGTLRVVDTTTRSILRSFGSGNGGGVGGKPNNSHSSSSTITTEIHPSLYNQIVGSVRCVKWLRDGKHLLSCGDDAIIRLWDISNIDSMPVAIFIGHGDSIRAVEVVTVSVPKNTKNDNKAQTGMTKSSNRSKRKRTQQERQRDSSVSGRREIVEEDKRYVLVTGGYDHTIRLWDLTRALHEIENKTKSQQKHQQQLPNIGLLSGTSKGSSGSSKINGVVNGSESCLLAVLRHGAPVEALLYIPPPSPTPPSSSPPEGAHAPASTITFPTIISAGGTSIKMWDLTTGNIVRINDNVHAKTITSLCLLADQNSYSGIAETEVASGASPSITSSSSTGSGDSNSSSNTRARRIISAGLDGFIRIYDAETLNCLHGHKMSSPILSLAMIIPVQNTVTKKIASASALRPVLAIGMSNGIVSIRRRRLLAVAQQGSKSSELRGGTQKFFMRGANATPDPDDYAVVVRETKRLQPFDKSLKAFRYGDALDEALASKRPQSVRN